MVWNYNNPELRPKDHFLDWISKITDVYNFVVFVSVIEDDHLLNATYYSPEVEEPLDSTAMLGNIVQSESPTGGGMYGTTTTAGTGGGGGVGGLYHNGGGSSMHHHHGGHSTMGHHHGGSQSHIDTAASVGKSMQN